MLGQPGEKRIALAGPDLFQALEPTDEGCRLLGHRYQPRSDLRPPPGKKGALCLQHRFIVLNRSLAEAGGQAPAIEPAEGLLLFSEIALRHF